MKTYISIIFVILIFYFGGASIALSFYLPEIIFKKSSDVNSSEDQRYKVKVDNNELLIRQYGRSLNKRCIIFFPGQHGGILRYENEIFKNIVKNNVTVFSLSYPGYEGASGKSDYTSVIETSKLALENIESETSCKINSSIFVGRSLGASVALEVAKLVQPKGLVVDSLAVSLSKSIQDKLNKSILSVPLNLLPIEKLISFNISTKDALERLKNIPIIVFQGEFDKITPLKNVEPLLIKYDNVSLNIVDVANHKNTQILAGKKYFDSIFKFM